MDKPWSEFLLDVPEEPKLKQRTDEAPLFGVDGYPVDLVAE